MLGTSTPPRGNVPGDVSCDGKVNSRDALLILQISAGLKNTLPCIKDADVNHDSRINPLDAQLVLQFDAGLLHFLPV